MSYVEKLKEWYIKETQDNNLVNIRFFQIQEVIESTPESSLEETCREIYKGLTGSNPVDLTNAIF